MVKPHKVLILMALLHILLLFSIAAVDGRPTTIHHRVLPPNCDPVFGICSDQWPFSPISSNNNNPYMPRPFLRRQLPPVVLPPPADSDPSFSPLVASPPPPRYTVTNPPPSDSDPTFSPLVASPPPPRRPLVGLSFSPPAADNLPPEVSLPPPVQDSMQPEPFYVVPAPPLVPIVSGTQDIMMPPPVDESAKTDPQLPPVAQSPPAD